MPTFIQILDDIHIHFPEKVVGHPAFLIQYDIPSEYHSFVFGTKQAGINDFDNIVHEICHAVQFQDMSRSMYGCFHFKEPERVSHNCSATMRELEVMAMKSNTKIILSNCLNGYY